MRREVIIKGVKDVEAALKYADEADRALIFTRIIERFQRARSVDALTILAKKAERRAQDIRLAAYRAESELSDPFRDPRPELVLKPKVVV